MNLYSLTIHEAQDLLKKKEISAKELVSAVIDRIETIDPDVGAYITVTKEIALSQADIADKTIAAGQMNTLTGIPIAIKDLICTRGIPTTCGYG